MPKVVEAGPYRVFFYSNERNEPPHVHVERDNRVAKFWLRPSSWPTRAVSLAAS
jgi:Domain of unknown function (DUF4160)